MLFMSMLLEECSAHIATYLPMVDHTAELWPTLQLLSENVSAFDLLAHLFSTLVVLQQCARVVLRIYTSIFPQSQFLYFPF